MATNLEIETNEDGVTVWIGEGKDRRWLLDASTILRGGDIDINTKDISVITYHTEDSNMNFEL